jgi:molybdenum cofactor cytidylyltransferase
MPSLPEASGITLGVVILAAGRSRRMGRPKLLLPWYASSVLGHLLAQWGALRARQIAVVCAPSDQALQAEVARLNFPSSQLIVNAAPENGMFSSIQTASRWPGWRPELTHWAIVLGDQPHLRQDTLRTVLALCAGNPDKVCQPAYLGRLRHPVLLPKAVFGRMAQADTPDFKSFLAGLSGKVLACDVEDPGLDLDIDCPADYEKALELARCGS